MQAGVGDMSGLGSLAGSPMVAWTSSFRFTYSITKLGAFFNGWPDGEATEEQPQLMLEVFDIMRDEALAVVNEESSK